MAEPHASTHERAARAFATQVRERLGGVVQTVLLYGSVARGDERGVGSDVDLLVVVRDEADRDEVADRVRDLAYDIELERGVVLSLLVLSAEEYEQRQDRPFYRHVRRDAETLYG
jgi:predicted nucleotidyltransferase